MAAHTIAIEPVEIDAPAEVAWQVLTDLEAYPEWNPFTVRARSSLVVGEPVHLYIPMGKAGKLMKQSFVLEVFDPPQKLAWRLPKLIHKKVMTAYREQTIESLGPDRCTYTTADTFEGWLAGRVFKSRGDWVRRNFVELAAALKVRAEGRN